MTKTTGGLILNIVWHVFIVLFKNFLSGLSACALSIRISGQNAQTKRRFLVIKRDIIKQNKHLLSKMETWECHQMKIMKGE